jgi:outer membrane protein OmpA-like peptidoglycan-associated protein
VEEDLYRNDVFVKNVHLKNVGDVTVTRLQGNRALHEGIFRYYTSEGISGEFMLEKEYPTKYYRDIYGKYDIEDIYFMPVVRGVPTFPQSPLGIGDQWTSSAHEAHDFRDVYSVSHPVIFPANVSYQYLGNMKLDGENIAKISINYIINHTMKYQYGMHVDIPLPYRIIGYFNQLYYWNLDRGVPHSYRENFDYVFIMTNGDTIEYVGTSSATLTTQELSADNNRSIEDVRTRLKLSIPDVQVTESPQGIVINIGEILFKFDSDELTDSASHDLFNIVEVLKEFNDRHIRVIGHTDSTGPEDYNLSLSLRRAKKTVTELIKKLPSLEGRITYVGMGERKPIATNETEEGRKQNRRVEIIILNK